MAAGVVRYVGEPLAVVVAEDGYAAEDAAELADLDIEPLPPVLEAAVAADEALGRQSKAKRSAAPAHPIGALVRSTGTGICGNSRILRRSPTLF